MDGYVILGIAPVKDDDDASNIYMINNDTGKIKTIVASIEWFKNAHGGICSRIRTTVLDGFVEDGIPYMQLLAKDDKGIIKNKFHRCNSDYYTIDNIYGSVVTAQFDIGPKMESPYHIMRVIEEEWVMPQQYPKQVWMYLKTHHADWIRDKLPAEKQLMLI